MKIFTITQYPLDRNDGPVTHLIEIAENLIKLGNDVIMFIPSGHPYPYKTPIKFIEVPLSNIPLIKTIFYNIMIFIYLLYEGYREKIDVFYIREYPMLFLPHLAGLLLGVPQFIEINGIMANEQKILSDIPIKIMLIKLFQGLGYLFVKNILAVSLAIKEELKKTIPTAHNLIVIPNGVNTDKFKPHNKKLAREYFNLSDDFFYIGFAGSFFTWQALELMINAFPYILEIESNIRFLFIGDGPLEESLKASVKEKKLDDKVIFLGRVKTTLAPLAINCLDIGLSFYLEQNFEKNLDKSFRSPIKLYSYMSCGVPIIGSEAGGIGEILRETKTGLSVKADDPKAVCDTVMKLYNDERLRQKMGKRGCEIVIKNYSWKDVAMKIEKILNNYF